MTDHNGKEIKVTVGKNVRLTDSGWAKIRKFCFLNNFKMGKFVEEAALEKIKQSKKKS